MSEFQKMLDAKDANEMVDLVTRISLGDPPVRDPVIKRLNKLLPSDEFGGVLSRLSRAAHDYDLWTREQESEELERGLSHKKKDYFQAREHTFAWPRRERAEEAWNEACQHLHEIWSQYSTSETTEG